MNGMDPGRAIGDSDPEAQDRHVVDELVDVGWLEDGPKLWRTGAGGAVLVDIEPGIAGSVYVRLSQHFSIEVDRLAPARITGFTLVATPGELSTEERSTLRYVVGDELLELLAGDVEGVLPFEVPPLPEDVQHLVLSCTAFEKIHPVFGLDAWAVDYQDSGTQRAADRLRARARPFADVLGRTLGVRPLDSSPDVENWGGVLDLALRLATSPTPVFKLGQATPDVGLDTAGILLDVAGGPRAQDELLPESPGEWATVPAFDLVDVDEVASAQFRVVDDTIEVIVDVDQQDVDQQYGPLRVVLTGESGELSVTDVVFEAGARRATSVFTVPDGDFWVEVRRSELAGRPRWERAAQAAESAVARVGAVLQAAGSAAVAGPGLIAIVNELRSAVVVFEGPALDPLRAQQVADLADDLDSGISIFRHRKPSAAAQLVVELQAVSADLAGAVLDAHDSAMLASLVARLQPIEMLDEVPDFVPLEWLIEELIRPPVATELPDKVPALAVNAEEVPFRVELTDEQTDATGITSIYIEFKDDIVTLTISRQRERAAYKLRIVDSSGQLAYTVSSNPVADTYIAHVEGGRESVKIELTLEARP